jgi:hypothetical protein
MAYQKYKNDKQDQKEKSETVQSLIESSENTLKIDIEEIRARALEEAKKTVHKWKQRGPWVECSTCPMKHGFYVGPQRRIKKINDNGTIEFEHSALFNK